MSIRIIPLVLLVATAVSAGCYSIAANSSSTNHSTPEGPMISQAVRINNIILLAKEEKRLIPGGDPSPNRDVGFATVLVQLENLTEQETRLTVKQIQILSTAGGQQQMVSPISEEIRLQPLEQSESDFYLSNRTGYSTEGPVKAIVTFQAGEQTYTADSLPIDVRRF